MSAELGTITIVDGKGERATTTLYWASFGEPAPTNFVSMMSALRDIAILIDQCIDGKMIGVTWSLDVGVEGDVKIIPSADSDIEQGVLLTMRTENGFTRSMRIATFREDLFNTDGSLDTGDPFVSTLLDVLKNGVDTGLAGLTPPTVTQYAMGDYRSDPIAFISGEENFKKTRKRK